MRAKNISTPLSMPTLWAPLSTSFRVEAGDMNGEPTTGRMPGGPLSQWHYITGNSFLPDRTVTPLILTAKLDAVDPESNKSYTEDISKVTGGVAQYMSVKWYLMNGTTETEITNTAASGDYVVGLTNRPFSLMVRKNVAGGSSVRIRCKCDWIDPRTNRQSHDETEITLTSQSVAEENYTLRLLVENVTTWNPFSGESPLVDIMAKARLGMTDKNADCKFFWYKVNAAHPDGILIDDDYALCPAYVSGQGTDTLRINADYCDGLQIMCRIASAKTATAPDQPVMAVVTIRWDLPRLACDPYSMGGSAIRATTGTVTVLPLMKADGKDIPDSIWKQRILLNWKRTTTATSTVTDLGFGEQIDIPAADLRQSGSNADKVNAVIFAEVCVLEPLLPLVDSNGKYIVDGSGKFVVGRIY